MLTTRTIPSFGWPNVLQLRNDATELQITTDVGPRILLYRTARGANVLRAYEDQMGTRGEAKYVVRGGHRLWVSPEIDLTYAPDNSTVLTEELAPGAVRLVNPPTLAAPLRKELRVTLHPETTRVRLEHTLINASQEPMKIASWALTVMAAGGWHLIPQPPLGSHDTDLLPQRVVVPWTYTDFSDPRWRFGRRFWQLHPHYSGGATKMGFALNRGWVAYILPDVVFFKTFPYLPGAEYPDLGCNYETFSKGDFIELETLSPLRTVAPGESVGHVEEWHLFGGDTPRPSAVDDAALAEWVKPFLSKIDIPA